MTRTNVFWLAAIVCTAAVFTARAQVATPAAPPMTPTGTAGDPGEGTASLDTLDRNRDGKLTPAEVRSHEELSRQFEALDRDGDGRLDKGEFARFEIGGQTSPTNRRSRGGVTSESDSDDASPNRDAHQPDSGR